MVNLEKYFNEQFRPLDVLGTTSFGPLAREIWRNTWARGKLSAIFSWYSTRKNLSTHTAITCIGRNRKRWIMEMDKTKSIVRYVNKETNEIKVPEEIDSLAFEKAKWREIKILSGVKLTDPKEYFVKDEKAAHVVWIGRDERVSDSQIDEGNEWIFDTWRNGVPYDLTDIFSMWDIADKLGINVVGSPNIYICSELVQKVFEHIGIFGKRFIPMTPMEWQLAPWMTTIKN